MIYRIECDKGHTYTQETSDLEDVSYRRPYLCGACGSRDIRVWALVYGIYGPMISVPIPEAIITSEDKTQTAIAYTTSTPTRSENED